MVVEGVEVKVGTATSKVGDDERFDFQGGVCMIPRMDGWGTDKAAKWLLIVL